MRQDLPKYIFVVVVLGVAFLARGDHGPSTQFSVGAANPASAVSGMADAGSSVSAPNVGAVAADPGAVAMSATSSAAPVIVSGGGTSPFSRVGSDPAPALDYHEALVEDLQSGAILFGDQDSSRWPLASVTKLMTAIIATDTISASQQITITPQAFSVDTSDVALSVGDTYTVSDLMRIMLLKSSNVAAEALADFYGHGRFLDAMNARAVALGMHNTYYGDPSGLSSGSQSSADDLGFLAQHIYNNYPGLLAITRMPQVTVTNLATGKKMLVRSINDFAGQSDFLGGKTGYTDIADGNLLSIFKYENRPVLVVIMGTDDAARFDNTKSLYNWFKTNFK